MVEATTAASTQVSTSTQQLSSSRESMQEEVEATTAASTQVSTSTLGTSTKVCTSTQESTSTQQQLRRVSL
jgi:hypothetical protein